MPANHFQKQLEQGSANLLVAARKFSAISGAMREEVADAGLAHISALLYTAGSAQPPSPGTAAYDNFLRDLQGIVGIAVLIAGSAPAPSPLWRDFQRIAADLLDTLIELKKLRAAIQ